MDVQLQSVLLPQEGICDIKELYYHEEKQRIIFDGYFNLIYIEKRKKYTNIQKLVLKIRLNGFDKFILLHDHEEIQQIELDEENEREYIIPFPYDKYDEGVFAFALVFEKQRGCLIEGMFWGEIEEPLFREVNIGIDICTYKREKDVLCNLQRLQENIFSRRDLEISCHSHIFLIDNGKTLNENEEIQGIDDNLKDKLNIIPNMNAGGSGGFTRGMIEILNRKEKDRYTHVLLMDDDAVVQPDMMVRLYGFLTTLKEEWKRITVGGMLFRLEDPKFLFCAGEWWKDGSTAVNPFYNKDMSDYENAAAAYLIVPAKEQELYSGWWCCCYSLETVREDNLPFPFFVHHDDIEYGIRNKDAGITFLNGVNVWHRNVITSMPGVMTYYDVRNLLIEMVLQKNPRKTAMKGMIRRMAGLLLRYRYKDVKLACIAIQDFLRGPMWVYQLKPESLHQSLLGQAEKLVLVERHEAKNIKRLKPGDAVSAYLRNRKVLTWDPETGRAVLLERKWKEILGCSCIMLKSLFRIQYEYDKIAGEYRKNIKKITTKEAWENYLGL